MSTTPTKYLPMRLAPLALTITLVLTPGWGQPGELSLDQKEQFLRTAKVIRKRDLSEGITRSSRATLSDGKLTHDAQIQDIDEFKQVFTSALGTELNFRDSYRYNIAAYRLARLLGLNMIPPSVERKIGGSSAAVTWWIDDFLMTEKERYFKKLGPPDSIRWNQQMYIVRVFDQLIYNVDRNLGNLVITKNWDLWMIDHTRSFRLNKRLKTEESLARCDRKLLEALRALDRTTLITQFGSVLRQGEIGALLARRDRIVEIFERKGAGPGGSEVLYDFLPDQR